MTPTTEQAPDRACDFCGVPLPVSKRKDARFCSRICSNRQWWVDHPERSKTIWRESSRRRRASDPTLQRAYRLSDIRRAIFNSAKNRAKREGIPFNLTIDDIPLVDTCPVLGIPLEVGHGRWTDASPSLDKIIPELGYTKGNVIIVSMRANRAKSNLTIGELQRLANFYTNLISQET